MPADCLAVEDNFFANDSGNTNARGVINSATTVGADIRTDNRDLAISTYEAAPDSLKVSYFIKSDATGTEFGDNAVHVADFIATPAMTNQQKGIFSADLQGFDYPDLNGGSPLDAVSGVGASRGAFNGLRSILSAPELINDWSANVRGDFSVDTDWVVTFPGQYVMLNLGEYIPRTVYGAGLENECLRVGEIPSNPDGDNVANCDYRDIPAEAVITVFDREEQGIVIEDGELVVSPQPPIIIETLTFDHEVNVIQWGSEPVLNAPVAISGLEVPAGASFGWANVMTTSAANNDMLCDWDLTTTPVSYACNVAAAGDDAPIVGFVAWQRNFGANPDANYGRIVEHSRIQSSS